MKRIAYFLAATVVFANCSKKDDSSSEDSSTDQVSNASSLVMTVNAALASIPADELGLASMMSGNALCTEHGQPVKDGVTTKKGKESLDADRLSEEDKDYPSRLFMCLATLTAEDGASVETIQGSLAQFSSVLCSFEEKLGAFEYTEEGNDLVNGTAVTMKLESSCWPQGTPEGMTEVTIDTATATALGEDTGYQKRLEFTSKSAGVDYTLNFFNKDGVIGFKTIDGGEKPGIGGYTEMVLDSKNGVVIVNVVDDRNGYGGADSSFRRVARLMVKGEMDENLTFKTLETLQGIRAESGNYEENEKAFKGATIKGTTADGFYGTSVSYDGSEMESLYAGCTGANSKCPSKGFTFKDDGFYNSRTEWATQLKSGLPPCYKDGEDLTFDAVPSTGAFGVCE